MLVDILIVFTLLYTHSFPVISKPFVYEQNLLFVINPACGTFNP